MSKHTPFTKYHSNKSATINGASVKDWVMYNAAEVDPVFSELLEVMQRALKLSKEHPDFKLYAMEPFEQAIKRATGGEG